MSDSEQPEPMYLTIGKSKEPVHDTTELLPGILFADFDKDGRLLGVEILGDGPPPERSCPHCGKPIL